MIEEIVKAFLQEMLGADIRVCFQEPPDPPEAMAVLERTGGGALGPGICTAQLTVQSYGGTMLEAIRLNSRVKAAMEQLPQLPEVSRCSLNADYNFTDTRTKRYRYQAVFDLIYYE